jgi:soluble lytic murein transglycosylase
LVWLSVAVFCLPARANDASHRADAAAAYDDGRYEDALAALSRGELTSDLLYLRMRTLAELGRFTEALDLSKNPPKGWPAAVVRELPTLRVSWAASAGRCDIVAKEGTAAGRAGERLIARCAFYARDFARVKALLASARDSEGRALYIRSLLELEEREAARPLARSFFVDYPAHPDAERFRPLLIDAKGELSLSPEEHLTRAQAWLSARQPESAHAQLASLGKSDDKQLEARIWHLRGEALFRTRKRYPEAEKAFTKAAKLGAETEDYDAFHAVRSTSRAGDDRTAIKGYKAFAAKYKKSRLVPDALYLSAWLSAREKLPSARADLKSFVESKYATQAPGLKREALWELGFHAVTKRDHKDATKWLEQYGRGSTQALERGRATYWLGRSALQARDEKGARALFSRTIREDRLGYYAQMAARRLAALDDAPVPAFEPAPAPFARPPVRSLPEDVRFYRELGLYTDAADAATRFLGNEGDREKRASVLLEAGEANRLYAAAEALLDRALEGPPDTGRLWIWQSLLPKPYLATVLAETEQRKLDSALFYGHMQVESHYKPRAISGADAMGLMQLLPETGEAVAKGLGSSVSRADLLRPHVNIRLGAAYLANLIDHFDGQFPLAIAAYNAGTHKVEEWVGHTGEVELDRWVESIPVEQTRNYVRRVITAWSRYHALVSPDRPWDLPLPAKVSMRAKKPE